MDGHADDGKWKKRKTEAWVSRNVKRETYCGRGPGNGGKLKRKLKEEKKKRKKEAESGTRPVTEDGKTEDRRERRPAFHA